MSLLAKRLICGAGLRYDIFRFDVKDRVQPMNSAVESSGRFQPKLSAAITPFRRLPVTLHADYGRGISSIDARSILSNRKSIKVANTEFWQLGISSRHDRLSVAVGAFYIAGSNEEAHRHS